MKALRRFGQHGAGRLSHGAGRCSPALGAKAERGRRARSEAMNSYAADGSIPTEVAVLLRLVAEIQQLKDLEKPFIRGNMGEHGTIKESARFRRCRWAHTARLLCIICFRRRLRKP